MRELAQSTPAVAGVVYPALTAQSASPRALSPVFDRALAFALLAKALSDQAGRGGTLGQRLGLSGDDLARFVAYCGWTGPDVRLDAAAASTTEEPEEQGWLRELLARHAAPHSPIAPALAGVIARRAMEANHLWEDLGLDSRSALNALMHRHFPTLAAMNDNGMRWKRFFYRRLCEEEGVVHCTSPTCGSCSDVDKCFEDGSAERSIAAAKMGPA